MKYYSQIGQDKYYIENISKGKTGGVFLDVGANDGIFESNTASLEFFYNWKGVCIEANPFLIERLQKNRPSSKVINCAIWDKGGEVEFEITNSNAFGIKGDLLSRINTLDRNKDYFKHHFEQDRLIVNVKAKTLTEVLSDNFEFPCKIDYMSLDVEGAEIEALKGIDFEKIKIEFMTVEHGGRTGYLEEMSDFLHKVGYKIHRINQWDVEFNK